MQKTQPLKNDCLHLAVLVVVALAIGLYLIATAVIIATDGAFYIGQAQILPRDPLGVANRYPIGYPALLFAAHRVAGLFVDGDAPAVWVYSSQAVTLLCRIMALIPLYLLGRLLVGGRRSFWAILVLIFLPHPAHYGSDVLREWPFVLFLASGFCLLIWAGRQRRWRLFGLVGLVSGLGYLIRPMCGQLVIYGLLVLLVMFLDGKERRTPMLFGAGLLLLLGFAIPVAPYLAWTGTVVPHQFRLPSFDSAPVIATVGDRSASHEPLRFAVQPGESFEVTIDAFDPDGDALVLSVVAIPLGTRPVFRSRSATHRADFWTIREEEKDALADSPLRTWSYAGIDYYAYPRADAASGVAPVYRFWSPVLSRHFYTMDRSEGVSITLRTPAHRWQSEGVAFYAWPEDHAPGDAAPVHRFHGSVGEYFWALEGETEAVATLAGREVEAQGVAWYGHAATAVPAGVTLKDGSLRWRPTPGQQGEHQLNVIASDGERQSCQLLRITVREAGGQEGHSENPPEDERLDRAKEPMAVQATDEDGLAPAEPISLLERMRIGRAVDAMDAVFDGVTEKLMVFFLVPLCVGLGCRLRYEAGLQERVLITAVLVANVGLMFGRHLWLGPQSVGRYSVGLIALSICYVPTGLAVMARWLRRCADRIFGDRGRPEVGEQVWFCVLLTIGVAICLPKLLRPMHAGSGGYRAVAAWLQEHTKTEDIIAVPDERISFYAGRQGRIYQQQPDPRKVDYVVILMADDSSGPPEGWHEQYACWADEQRGVRLVVYRVE